MKKQIVISLILLISILTANAQPTRMLAAEIFDNNVYSGYFGRGGYITHGWDNIAPDALTISYQKDFAIGGWAKSDGIWRGCSLFINSDNRYVGINTTTPQTPLDVNGIVRSKTTEFYEDNTFIGFLGRGSANTMGWSQLPDIFTLTYYKRDFAIGGWRKSDGIFNGASFYINSDNGFIGIGTTNPDTKLAVKGTIHATEVKVDLSVPADYVFKANYNLMPLPEVEKYVKTNNHLPEIPSASEIKENGLSLGEMQNKLLQKVEELTLYVIEQQKQIEALKKENEQMKKDHVSK